MPLHWTKRKNRFGETVGYASKCGKFYIERKEWELPVRHVGWRLHARDQFTPALVKDITHEHDTLREAKEDAEDMTPEGGWNLISLPAILGVI